MPTRSNIVHVQSGCELGQLLDEAAEASLILEKEGVRYRLSRIKAPVSDDDAPRRRKRLEPERILNIIGIGASAEGSDIARFKDQYIADAADHRAK